MCLEVRAALAARQPRANPNPVCSLQRKLVWLLPSLFGGQGVFVSVFEEELTPMSQYSPQSRVTQGRALGGHCWSWGVRKVAAMRCFHGGLEGEVSLFFHSDQQLAEGMEAPQEILESCHVEPETHSSVRAEHERKKGPRSREALFSNKHW